MSATKPHTLGEHLSLSLENFERFNTRAGNYATAIHRLKALIDLSAQSGVLNNGYASECIMLCEQVTAGDEAARQFVRLQSKFIELTNLQRLQYLRIVLSLLGDDGVVIDWLTETATVAADVPDYTDEDLKHVKVTTPEIPSESFRVGPTGPVEPPPVEQVGPVELEFAPDDDGSEEKIDDAIAFAWAGDPKDRIDPSLLGNLLDDPTES